jgi:hypothetical protein
MDKSLADQADQAIGLVIEGRLPAVQGQPSCAQRSRLLPCFGDSYRVATDRLDVKQYSVHGDDASTGKRCGAHAH